MELKMEQIVAEHIGLVKSVALRLSYIYGEEQEDLIQIGYIGLIKAAQRFEPERGLKFSTYAVPMIAGEIRSQLRDSGSIKVSRSIKKDMIAIKKAQEQWISTKGFSPRISDIAELANLAEERIIEVMQAADASQNFEELENAVVAIKEEEENVTKIDISITLNSLDEKEKQVIILRYYRDFTQIQVAKALGISQVQVCRIEKKALKNMATKMSI